jgi:hypothetical protein
MLLRPGCRLIVAPREPTGPPGLTPPPPDRPQLRSYGGRRQQPTGTARTFWRDHEIFSEAEHASQIFTALSPGGRQRPVLSQQRAQIRPPSGFRGDTPEVAADLRVVSSRARSAGPAVSTMEPRPTPGQLRTGASGSLQSRSFSRRPSERSHPNESTDQRPVDGPRRAGRITQSDRITIELVAPDGMPAASRIFSPTAPTIVATR